MSPVEFLTLALQVATLLAVVRPAKTSPAPEPCTEYLLDQCKQASGDDPQVEVIHNADVNQCAFFCNIIYASDGCQFYIYDAKQNICEIWKISQQEYQDGCTKREGPVGDGRDNTAEKCSAPPTGTGCEVR